MRRQQNPNLKIVIDIVDKLGDLAEQMVFVGGCTAGLLITDNAAPPIRVTKDVDVIVDIVSLIAYHRLADELRLHGFREDTRNDAPVCRWVAGDSILDVMPTDTTVLGFGNQWYKSALANAVKHRLPNGIDHTCDIGSLLSNH